MNRASWTFFQAFLKSPRVVASLVPSSPFLERRLVQAGRLADARVVVELGAGTGGTTRAFLAAMRPDARLIAIERTEQFVDGLNGIDDSRLEVVHGCASTVRAELDRHGLDAADAVLSGIPFSTLPPTLAGDIVREVFDALKPGGRFIAYQLSDRVADYARPVFGAATVEHELRNIPPLRVFTWQKS